MSTNPSPPPPASPPILMGDVYMLDWTPGRCSEQTGVRPAIVVQNNAYNANPHYPNTIVVTVSKHGRPIRTHVEIPQTVENGLSEPISYARCEQLFTVDKARLMRKLGNITPEQLAAICRALKRVLNLV